MIDITHVVSDRKTAHTGAKPIGMRRRASMPVDYLRSALEVSGSRRLRVTYTRAHPCFSLQRRVSGWRLRHLCIQTLHSERSRNMPVGEAQLLRACRVVGTREASNLMVERCAVGRVSITFARGYNCPALKPLPRQRSSVSSNYDRCSQPKHQLVWLHRRLLLLLYCELSHDCIISSADTVLSGLGPR